MTNQNKLDYFIGEIHAIVAEGGTEKETTAKVSEALDSFINSGYELEDKFKVPNKEKYVLYPVYIAPDESFSIAAAVWDVGQAAPVHDHRTWGVIGIMEGIEHEISYIRPKENEEKPLTLLHDVYLREGEVSVCCTTDQDVHEVSCASDIPCVGLHVYGDDIGKITRYLYNVETGEKNAVVTKWDKIPS